MFNNDYYRGWRWDSNQHVWWIFLFAYSTARDIGVSFECHGCYYHRDDNTAGNSIRPFIRISLPFIGTLMMAIPRFRFLLRTFAGRRYGFSYDMSAGFFQMFYGAHRPIGGESKLWCCHVPWSDMRLSRYRYYDTDGLTVVKTLHQRNGHIAFEESWGYENSAELPRAVYQLMDYDGASIACVAYVMDRTWKHGRGWFRWMSLFVPDTVRKVAELSFTPGYGRDKHSWKGGTCGHSIELRRGESLDDAVWRYCEERDLAYGGRRS